MRRLVRIAAVITAGVVSAFFGVVSRQSEMAGTLAYDTAMFKNGDLIFVTGKSLRSYIVLLLEKNNSEFSHIGLVWVKEGIPFVIHATPTPPGEMEQGMVIIEPMSRFLSRKQIRQAALYRLKTDSTGVAEIAASIANDFAAKATPFDHQFSLTTASTLYCTEMVWLAYKQAGLNLLGKPDDELDDILLPSALSESQHLAEVARFK